MFTGIVEETGTVRDVSRTEGGRRLTIGTSFDGLTEGQSVSVSGVCLTVEAQRTGAAEGEFDVFLATETLDRTYLKHLTVGDQVNLERALPADGRLDGHFVQGHVDGTGEVTAIDQLGDDWRFAFSLPAALDRYLVEKGSIAVDGISLTVAACEDGGFAAAIIPETYDRTTLSAKAVGDPVHLEVDVVAKYVEGLLEGHTR